MRCWAQTSRVRSVKTIVIVLLAVGMTLGWPAAVSRSAYAADAQHEMTPLTIADIEGRRPPLEKEITQVNRQIETLQAQSRDVEAEALKSYALILMRLKSAYEQLQTALNKNRSLTEEKTLLTEKGSGTAVSPIPDKPPYNLSYYDRIWNELETIEQQRANTALAVSLSEGLLEDARQQMADVNREQRAARDQIRSGAAEPGAAMGVAASMDKRVVLMAVLYQIETVNRQNLELQLAIENIEKKALGQKLEWVRQRLHFDVADLDKQLQHFSEMRGVLQDRLAELKDGREKAEARWLQAQQATGRVGQGADPSGTRAFVRERDAWRQAYQIVLEQTEARLRLLTHGEEIWRLRYAIVRGQIDRTDLVMRQQEIENHLRNLERILNLEQHYQTDLQAQILAVEKELADLGSEPKKRGHLENQVRALRKLSERRFEYRAALISAQQLDRRILDEINARLDTSSVSEKLTGVTDQVKRLWGTELWVLDGHAVTLRKLSVALLALIIGIVAIHYLVKVASQKMKRVPYFRETTTRNLQKVFTYVAYLLVVLFALRIVNIPLTAFAFLGGAIAIGVGFGAQNLINNFISGFIMMAERPISIGDLIEVDGIVGQVEEIGARCTRVRTGENIHILVPNSAFLENNITNWTLSGHQIRTHVSVGVVYGSDVRLVQDKLLQAVKEQPNVLKTPSPFVLFRDFGDNALVFEVYFWALVRRVLERRKIESDIRFRIEDLFNAAGIVVAFPQRDVHLDTTQPLRLQLMDREPASGADPVSGG